MDGWCLKKPCRTVATRRCELFEMRLFVTEKFSRPIHAYDYEYRTVSLYAATQPLTVVVVRSGQIHPNTVTEQKLFDRSRIKRK